jgi:hypothetical protein
MQNNIQTIEDCIETIIPTPGNAPLFDIETTDQILMSLARQTRRNIALTDKQHNLAKEKILKYRDAFKSNTSINIDNVIENTRLPIRLVDRSKTVILEKFKRPNDSAPPCDFIKIRFPFNKKTMQQITEIVHSVLKHKNVEYFHETGTHVHYLRFTEETVEQIVEIFSKKKFYIEPYLLDVYQEIVDLKKNPEKVLPCVFDNSVRNLPDVAITLLEKEIGKVSVDNRLLYRDRSIRYGLSYFDFEIVPSTIVEKIALRNTPNVSISPTVEFSKIIESLVELKRFPILVLINDVSKGIEILNETRKVYNEFSKYCLNTEQSVLFRVDNVSNVYTVNDFIKENSLNNWVDENTKVVYIMKSRLPTLLFAGNWQPITSISLTSDIRNPTVDSYVAQHCDLVLNYDSYISTIRKLYKEKNIDVIH